VKITTLVMAIPVILVAEEVVLGFDRGRLLRLLGR